MSVPKFAAKSKKPSSNDPEEEKSSKGKGK